MRTLFLLIWTLIFLVVGQNDPCNETRYLELKEMPLDSMSPRQYEYFMLKEKYCHEKATNNFETKKSELCTIKIIVDSLYHYGEKLPINVFIDGVSYGKPPKTIEVTEGIHTIDLFSDEGFERKKSFGITNQNNKKSRLNIKCSSKSKTLIVYKFGCEEGGNRKCDWDEWYFLGDVKNF